MKIITKQSKVIPGIETFFQVYPRYATPNAPFYTKERFDRISKLVPETCTVYEFNIAIDHPSWTENRCDECGEDFDILLHIGDDVDYDARWQCLCAGCIVKALGVLAEYEEKNDE